MTVFLKAFLKLKNPGKKLQTTKIDREDCFNVICHILHILKYLYFVCHGTLTVTGNEDSLYTEVHLSLFDLKNKKCKLLVF